MEKCISQRGNKLIIYNKFKFRFEETVKTTDEERWRCTVKKCKAKLFTMEDGNVFSRTCDDPNHDPVSDNTLNRQRISTGVKRKAEADPEERPTKIIHQEISQRSDVLSTLKKYDMRLLKNTVSRAKLKLLPKLPKTSEEVFSALDEIEVQTIKDEKFLLCSEKNKGVVLFSCSSNIKFLCESEIILMDGTFEYCPKLFTQLFTVHAYSGGVYVPLVFFLLKDKNKVTYAEAFDILRSECVNRDLELKPKYVVIDFEEAIHTAATSKFQDVTIVGCRFHLAQAWWRKIQNLGLAPLYRNSDSEEGKWLRYCFGLTYLDPDEVPDAFCDLIGIQPADARLTKFADYLTDTYIDGENKASFPPKIWASASSEHWRTTNACEGFHSKFNTACPTSHPNIFQFIKCLKSVQIDTYVLLNSAHSGKTPRDKKAQKKQEFLERKFVQLRNGQISRLDFLKCVSYRSCVHK